MGNLHTDPFIRPLSHLSQCMEVVVDLVICQVRRPILIILVPGSVSALSVRWDGPEMMLDGHDVISVRAVLLESHLKASEWVGIPCGKILQGNQNN